MTIYDTKNNKQYWKDWTEHMQRYVEDLGDVDKEELDEYMVGFWDVVSYKREHE